MPADIDYSYGGVGEPQSGDLADRERKIREWEWEHVLSHQISSIDNVLHVGGGQATIVVNLRKCGFQATTKDT